MKRQAKRLERLKYQGFGFIQAGTGVPLPFLSPCFYWALYGQAPIVNKHPFGGAFMNTLNPDHD
ncbi:hypothetical protein DP175_05690 [Polynucleobacter paneuropaeus]|jgi:hypothetical protein|nr:hypothetical protein DP175_05690 [Polynucleobacter paneuropaeus]